MESDRTEHATCERPAREVIGEALLEPNNWELRVFGGKWETFEFWRHLVIDRLISATMRRVGTNPRPILDTPDIDDWLCSPQYPSNGRNLKALQKPTTTKDK